MPRTDFFDDDLVKQRDPAKRIRMGPGDSPGTAAEEPAGPEDVLLRPVSDLNLTRMAKHKEEVTAQVAQAMEELERLRTRQETLEREKQDLEELRRKQHEYEAGKREVMSHLNQSLVRVEKEEQRADQLVELLASTRAKFKALLSELELLNEAVWPDNAIREELEKALVRIDQVRLDYNKTMAKVESTITDAAPAAGGRSPMLIEDHGLAHAEERGFGYWFVAGLAATLPLIVTLLILAALHYMTQIGIL